MRPERKPCVLWGVPIVLTTIFALLKATGMITWTWFLVFWPFWVPITFGIGIGILSIIMLYLGINLDEKEE